MDVILRCKLAMHNKQMSELSHVGLFQFSQLCFCQILFELVYRLISYHKNKNSELFIETQCIKLL